MREADGLIEALHDKIIIHLLQDDDSNSEDSDDNLGIQLLYSD